MLQQGMQSGREQLLPEGLWGGHGLKQTELKGEGGAPAWDPDIGGWVVSASGNDIFPVTPASLLAQP